MVEHENQNSMVTDFYPVHVYNIVLIEDIHAEVKIHLHCSSHNLKIIHGQVQPTQDLFLMGVRTSPNIKNMYCYLTKHLKLCGFTLYKITVRLIKSIIHVQSPHIIVLETYTRESSWIGTNNNYQ